MKSCRAVKRGTPASDRPRAHDRSGDDALPRRDPATGRCDDRVIRGARDHRAALIACSAALATEPSWPYLAGWHVAGGTLAVEARVGFCWPYRRCSCCCPDRAASSPRPTGSSSAYSRCSWRNPQAPPTASWRSACPARLGRPAARSLTAKTKSTLPTRRLAVTTSDPPAFAARSIGFARMAIHLGRKLPVMR